MGRKGITKASSDHGEAEEARLLPFVEIMNQGRPEAQFEQPDQSEDDELATATLCMNSLMVIQHEILAGGGFRLSDEAPEEEPPGSPVSPARTSSAGFQSALGLPGGMSAARYERLFREGNNGDQILRDLMVEVRKNWREGLRAACRCLASWKGPHAPSSPAVVTI